MSHSEKCERCGIRPATHTVPCRVCQSFHVLCKQCRDTYTEHYFCESSVCFLMEPILQERKILDDKLWSISFPFQCLPLAVMISLPTRHERFPPGRTGKVCSPDHVPKQTDPLRIVHTWKPGCWSQYWRYDRSPGIGGATHGRHTLPGLHGVDDGHSASGPGH